MADNLLDLTTLIEQPTISIDGVQYEILHPDQLSIVDAHHLQSMALRIEKITKQPDIDDDGAADLSAMVIDLSDRIMIGVPPEIRAKLTEAQRLVVAEVFMTIPRAQSRATRRKAKAAKPKANRSVGSKPRSGASGSMAEALTDG